MMKSIFYMCKYAMNNAYEGRKEINKVMAKMGLETREIAPPPVFPPPSDSIDDEGEREFPFDNETLGATTSSLWRQRRQSRPQRYKVTTHRMARAVVSDSEEETEDRTTTGSRLQTNPSDDDSDWE
jgi:hypothetical protein